jgi:hypothetical protein
VCFETYDSREAGAQDYLRVLLVRHGGARAVNSGSAEAMAKVMYENRYFGGFGATPEERIGHYADAIASSAATVASSLGESVMVSRGMPPIVPHPVSTGFMVAGAALVGWSVWKALGRKRKR